jgi:ElaB/YqjD/DUF883 family membrane-anchored ribosome-binding protein
MFGHAEVRSPRARVAALMRNIRDLEAQVRRLAPADVSRASADAADTVGTALEDAAHRFRNGAEYAANEAARLGQRASAAGKDTFGFLKGEVDAHPLAILGVAAGIGILIGASLYRGSRNSSSAAKPRRPTKRRARK